MFVGFQEMETVCRHCKSIFPGEPGLAGLIGAKDDEGSDDNCSY